MTHRDRAGDASGQRAGRREAAGDAGHRQGFPTPARWPAAGSPARPERRLPKAFGRPMALRWGTWLPMSRIATPRAGSPKALGSRLYGSLLRTFGIRAWPQARADGTRPRRRGSPVPGGGAGGQRVGRKTRPPSPVSLMVIFPGDVRSPETSEDALLCANFLPSRAACRPRYRYRSRPWPSTAAAARLTPMVGASPITARTTYA